MAGSVCGLLSGCGYGFVSVRGAAIPQAAGSAAIPYADWARGRIVELQFQPAGTDRGRQAESALIWSALFQPASIMAPSGSLTLSSDEHSFPGAAAAGGTAVGAGGEDCPFEKARMYTMSARTSSSLARAGSSGGIFSPLPLRMTSNIFWSYL